MGYLLNPYSLKASSISYRYVKWYITDLRNKSTANSVQVSEFRLRNLGSNLTMSGTATNPGGSNPGAETPPKVIDGSTITKWLDFNIKSSSTGFTSTLIIDMGVATIFDGYTWWTANDATERDPKTWQILGSNDNSNYTLLHEVIGFTATTSRRTNVGNFTI
jgi:hypothetical protein